MAVSISLLRCALALFVFNFGLSSALQNNVADDGVVCLSIVAYEDEHWIDALIMDAMHFGEPTTRVVLHLNNQSKYSEETLARWETDRVTVSPERVKVMPFMGSILYAHMLNAKQMDRRWPIGSKEKPCAFFVLQASNMMWVRKGFEAEVRQRRFAYLASNTVHHGCQNGVLITDEVSKPKGLYGWSRPEGSFFPMDTVRGFLGLMDKHLKAHNNDGSMIVDAKCYLEAFTLQTYALNFNDFSDEDLQRLKETHTLTWVDISYGDKAHDSCPLSEVQAVVESKKNFEPYYSIKRVNRDLSHPVTKYIMSLTR